MGKKKKERKCGDDVLLVFFLSRTEHGYTHFWGATEYSFDQFHWERWPSALNNFFSTET